MCIILTNLLRDLESLVDPVTPGDPMSPFQWTCKSTRQLSTESDLGIKTYPVGDCLGQRKIYEAIHEGNRAARHLFSMTTLSGIKT